MNAIKDLFGALLLSLAIILPICGYDASQKHEASAFWFVLIGGACCAGAVQVIRSK